ncbi:MAG: ketoacyl-ACP synthase III [Victivallales bacterium]|nr:ketoacyl-ACP synthase III [Victivallales bacterium]
MGIKIIGTGSYTPEKVLTNSELEKMVETNDEWITSRTGIKERRIAEDDEATVGMGTKAAKKALDMAETSPEDIDLIIYATVTPDQPLPSNACLIQKNLNAKNAACFDFQAACSGFIYGLEIASSMMKFNTRYKNVLLLGGEKLSAITDWTDRGTCILFGDAAGAVVLTKTIENKDTLISSTMYADGTHFDLLEIQGGGSLHPITEDNINDHTHCIKMAGNKVFKLAVNAMVKSSKEAMEIAHVTPAEIKWLIPHQANMRIMTAVAERLGFAVEKVPVNLDKHGNTSAASIILSLDEYVRDGKISKGDKVLLTAFGGGMTWGACVLEW